MAADAAAAGAATVAQSGPGPRRIALGVDDFGLSAGVDRAVLRLATQRRLNAVSCMVGAPAWSADCSALRSLDAAQVDIGLHLDLTQFPLRDGSRRTLRGWLLAAALRSIERAPLRAEIEAQLDAFERSLGRAPAHLDGHQHVHQLPVVRELLLESLTRRYRARLPWLRSTLPPRGVLALARWSRGAAFKPWVLAALGGRRLHRQATAAGLVQNRHLLGVYGFDQQAAGYRALLGAWLRLAGDGDLLMCHVGAPAGAAADDVIRAARAAEFEVIGGSGFDALLADAGVTQSPISRSVPGAACAPE